jgi:hypothetical protein
MADGLKLIVSKIVSSADSVFEKKKKSVIHPMLSG